MKKQGNYEKLKIDLVGKNQEVFNRLFTKLTNTIIDSLNSISEKEITENSKDTIKDYVSVAQEFIQAKLQKPSIENENYLADITFEC